VHEAIEAEWTSHLGARRIRQLREALVMLLDVTDPYQPQAPSEQANGRTT
jgi:hypothetical protein